MKFREGFIQISYSKSKTFLVFCFCFFAGITLASVFEKEISVWYAVSIVCILGCGIYVWKDSRILRFSLLCILCLVLGIFRYQIAFPPDTKQFIHTYAENTVSLIGFVSTEPDIRTDGIRYQVRIEKFKNSDEKINGDVYVKSDLYPRYHYGEELQLKCVIQIPEPIEDATTGLTFRYDRYLSRYGIFSVCAKPQMEVTGAIKGNFLYRGIFTFKEILGSHINQLWHEPYASFVAGLLYGYRGGLGSLNDLFSITGVTHIVAISGYNITLIATIFISVCKAVYIPRKKAFWVIIVGISIFVIFAGASASVVRAAVMGILVLIAKQTGRTSAIGNVLVLTAVIMSIQNPFILIWDAGFQLSFLSTLGLVYLSPLISPAFEKITEFAGLKETLISTLSAIGATLPLILFQFGRLSIVAPVVNILILWIIPWIMIAGALAVTLSFVWLPVAQITAFVAYAGMEYIIRVVTFFAHIPFASFTMRIPVWLMAVLYLLLIVGRQKFRIKKSV